MRSTTVVFFYRSSSAVPLRVAQKPPVYIFSTKVCCCHLGGGKIVIHGLLVSLSCWRWCGPKRILIVASWEAAEDIHMYNDIWIYYIWKLWFLRFSILWTWTIGVQKVHWVWLHHVLSAGSLKCGTRCMDSGHRTRLRLAGRRWKSGEAPEIGRNNDGRVQRLGSP